VVLVAEEFRVVASPAPTRAAASEMNTRARMMEVVSCFEGGGGVAESLSQWGI
jgi:carbamate kinase